MVGVDSPPPPPLGTPPNDDDDDGPIPEDEATEATDGDSNGADAFILEDQFKRLDLGNWRSQQQHIL